MTVVSADFDPEEWLAALCERLVEAILGPFHDEESDLCLEALCHDYSPMVGTRNEDFAYLGHSIEAYWFVMDEAKRAGRRDWYALALQRLRRHIEVAWDPMYVGQRTHYLFFFPPFFFPVEGASLFSRALLSCPCLVRSK